MSGLAVFFSYSHEDEELREQLEAHLSLLQREGTIRAWDGRRVTAGTEWKDEVDENLQQADIILLLVSSSFIASDYSWDVEVHRAMERHAAGEAKVIPIILRPADWSRAPFGKLKPLPKNGKPVTTWPNRDEAFLDVVQGLRAAIDSMPRPAVEAPDAPAPPAVAPPAPSPPLVVVPPAVSSPGLDLRTLRDQGLLDELASVFDTEAAAIGLLERAGVPRGRLRPFGATAPIHFWESVCRELEKGLTSGGLATLLREAAKEFPYNSKFQEGVTLAAGSPPAAPPPAASPPAAPPTTASPPGLAEWKEQLNHLLREEAITSDALQKFTIKKQIEQARQKIRELQG